MSHPRHRRPSAIGIRVLHSHEFYDKVEVDFDKGLADNGDPVRKAAKPRDPNAKRVNNGIEGDARRSTPEIGKRVSGMKVDDAVDQIRRLLK